MATTEPRILVFWLGKGCRKAKMRGSARSAGSARDINIWRHMARKGEGTLWLLQIDPAIVKSVNSTVANYGRLMIKIYRECRKTGVMIEQTKALPRTN